MGLDTYASRYSPEYLATPKTEWEQMSEETRPCMTIPMEDKLFSKIPNVLCGGLFSGNGAGNSFRGKVYNDVVEYVTGQSLYQEAIPPETVREMADKLEAKTHMDLSNSFYAKYDIKPAELQALAKWFRVVADEGGIVIGWW
jgi:hypothetical protein